MIVWHPRPFIFVHIPKNAGTSIEKSLIRDFLEVSDFSDLSPRMRKEHHLPGAGHALQHDKLRRYEELYDLDQFFTFSVVRNPFDRAISQISYLRRACPQAKDVFRGTSWKDWLMKLASLNKWMYGHDLGATQTDYLTNSSGELQCDFILRFEDLEADWEELKRILAIDGRFELPHLFRSAREPYRACYDSESREAIAAKYEKDLTEFDYKY